MRWSGGSFLGSTERNLPTSLLLRQLLLWIFDLIGRVHSWYHVCAMITEIWSGAKGRRWGAFCFSTELDVLTLLLLWPLAPLRSGLIRKVRSSSLTWTMVLGLSSGVMGRSGRQLSWITRAQPSHLVAASAIAPLGFRGCWEGVQRLPGLGYGLGDGLRGQGAELEVFSATH